MKNNETNCHMSIIIENVGQEWIETQCHMSIIIENVVMAGNETQCHIYVNHNRERGPGGD